MRDTLPVTGKDLVCLDDKKLSVVEIGPTGCD